MTTLGTRIKKLRIIEDLSQEELGRRVGVQRAAIQKYEKGTVTNIPINTIEKIANVLNVSPAYIVGWDSNGDDPLAMEVKIVQGVKKLFGNQAVDLLETYTQLDNMGKKKLYQYSIDMFKLHGSQDNL